MKPPIENLELIRKAKNFSREFVAQKLKVTLSSYGKIERGETAITLDRLYELADIFKMPPEDILNYNRPKTGNVTYVPIEAQAGFLSGHSQEYMEEHTMYYMPFITGSKLYMIHAVGDSMLPTINPGDPIIIEEVKERENLKLGKIYVVVSSEGLVLKRIYSSNNTDRLTLKSDNTIYEPYEVTKDEIISVWQLKGCFDQSLTPKNPFLLAERVNQQFYKTVQG